MTDESINEPDRAVEGANADLGTRLVARIIDAAILSAVFFMILVPLVIGSIFAGAVGMPFFGGFRGSSFVSSLIFAALTIGYYAFMEARFGQTVGKMAMSLKVVGPSGANPTIEEGVKRNLWLALSVVPWIGGLAQLAVMIYIAVTISNSATNTGWHDEFAGGTRVVRKER